MGRKFTKLQLTFDILNSGFLIVIATYFLDVIFQFSGDQGLGPLVTALLIAVKIYLYSGLYGHLVEIASGEEVFFNLGNFHRNAKRYWGIYFIFSLLPFLIHNVIVTLFPAGGKILATIFVRHLGVMILGILAFSIIYKKYLKPFHLPYRKIVIPSSDVIVLGILYLAEMVFFYQPQCVTITDENVVNVLALAAKYVHFLGFIYLSLLILDAYPEIARRWEQGKELYIVFPDLNGRESPIMGLLLKFLFGQHPGVFVVFRALTPKNYKVREFNRVIWHDRYYKANKLVAIGCFTSSCAEAYKIAKEFKKRGSTVIMGGPHVTYLPEEALEYCDSVVIGEAEGVWEQIIRDYENHSLKKQYSGGRVEECHHLVYEELLSSPPKVIRDFLETSRGCKFKCHFCTIPSLSGGGKVRSNPVFELVELLKKVRQKYRRVIFLDNNIYNDPAYAREFFKAIKPLKLIWYSPCTIDIAKNEEILHLAKEAGCEMFIIGYEVVDHSLEKEKGKFLMADKYIEYTEKIRKAGIRIRATFTFGWDHQTWKSWWEWAGFCLKIKPFLAVPFLLTPFPGTSLFEDLLREKRIINLNWKKYNQWHFVINHPRFDSLVMERIYPIICALSYTFLSNLGYALIFIFTIIVVLSLFLAFSFFLSPEKIKILTSYFIR